MDKYTVEKESLEVSAFKIFVDLYNKENASFLRLVEQRKPPYPDLYCQLNSGDLDIEVAHIYGTNVDAQRILARKRRNPFTKKELKNNRLIPLSNKIPAKLNLLLADKAHKKYKSDRVWLLIRNTHPAWTKHDFQFYLSDIVVPDENPFEEIWLVCDTRGYSGILRLL